MRGILLFCIGLIGLIGLNAQAQVPPEIAWQGCFGGSATEGPPLIAATPDGGLVFVGYTQSNNGQVAGCFGGTDIWVAKLDESGSLQWQRCLGGSASDSPAGIHALADGGVLVIGSASSSDGLVAGQLGAGDIWVVKLTAQGVIDWQQNYGGSGSESAAATRMRPNGNIVIVGNSRQVNGDVTQNYGSADVWVIEITQMGELVWQRSYGGPGEETGWAIGLADDGGLLALGISSMNGGMVQGIHGANDIWAIRIAAGGQLLWQRCLGGSDYDWGFGALQTMNGNWIISGTTESSNGDIAGHHGLNDAWLVRLDDAGGLVWQRPFGGAQTETFGQVIELADGSLLISGSTSSNDGDVVGQPVSNDAWLLSISGDGTAIQWQALYGGSGFDSFNQLHRESFTGFMLGGRTNSNNGDVSGNHGGSDIWLVRLAPITAVQESPLPPPISVYPLPATDACFVRLPVGWVGPTDCALFDPSGRLVQRQTLRASELEHQIDIAWLTAGTYSVVLRGPHLLARGQVVKAH